MEQLHKQQVADVKSRGNRTQQLTPKSQILVIIKNKQQQQQISYNIQGLKNFRQKNTSQGLKIAKFQSKSRPIYIKKCCIKIEFGKKFLAYCGK
jgi:hypothetical protein